MAVSCVPLRARRFAQLPMGDDPLGTLFGGADANAYGLYTRDAPAISHWPISRERALHAALLNGKMLSLVRRLNAREGVAAPAGEGEAAKPASTKKGKKKNRG